MPRMIGAVRVVYRRINAALYCDLFDNLKVSVNPFCLALSIPSVYHVFFR